MLTWLTIKKILKRIWAWLKHYWYAPAVVLYTIILWFLFRRREGAQEVLEIRNESYQKQIDAINEAHRKELEKRDQILEKYGDLSNRLEEKYAEEEEELDNQKKKRLKEIIEKHYNNPDELARLLAEEYGLEYVE